jgi:hypothetical protein
MSGYNQTKWKTPEELIRIGYSQSRVVMMNEAHNGLARCRRTREVGMNILPVAHEIGVRHIAMEVFNPEIVIELNNIRRLPDNTNGYLGQDEMRSFIQNALDLGWTFVAYEVNSLMWLRSKYPDSFPSELSTEETIQMYRKYQAELLTDEYTNYRELQQAKNLATFLASVPQTTKLLVWCGNSHHSKIPIDNWFPMGYQFQKMSNISPFCINQNITVKFDEEHSSYTQAILDELSEELQRYNGTAGFLADEAPLIVQGWNDFDGIILSLDNEMME